MDKNNKAYVLYLVIFVVIVYLGYNFYQFATYLEEQGECGMAAGPIYGNKLEISNLNVKIDQYFEFPNGKIGFSNLFDTNPPKIIKFTKDGQIIWGYEFFGK
ncbi:MAG: hypothetical protein H6567_02855 [Lewinellaceae bacterium]|nr:hypothetical protein [Lewinellaceae bacterium]